MKRFLAVLLLCSASAVAQPIMRQAATTNSTPKLPNLLPANTNPLFPLSVLDPDGTGADRSFHFTPGFSLTGSNMTVPGNLSLNGRTNRLSIANDQLLLDGVAISGSSESAPVTNFYATTINVTTQNFVLGNGAKLTITNYVRFPFSTLTLTGTNVSAISLTNSMAFKLILTGNAFFAAPTDFPGTNLLQTIQLHLQQDSTGSRSIMFTNSAWVLAGSGESTNAQPTINTNANGVTILTFASSPFFSGKLYGVPTAFTP